ncbi:hypothetical protein HK102_010536, partial [Quaeritorhiza haematococci]
MGGTTSSSPASTLAPGTNTTSISTGTTGATGGGSGLMSAPEYQIVLCTHRAIGLQYYKYTISGINIIFINFLALVVFSLVDFYFIGPHFGYTGIASHKIIFISALLSVIPLAYLIGMAVSSITAQTGNLALGAVINATFGSIVEIILYCLALMEGKDRIVEGSIIGSFLCGLLALPGAAMFSGGLVRKEQRFNAKSAGVTSTMLIMALIGAFTPTLFQEVYGTFELRCGECPASIFTPPPSSHGVDATGNFSTAVGADSTAAAAMLLACKGCRYTQPHPTLDPIYKKHTRPLMYFCAVCLVMTYGIGLWFTLRTHAKRIYPSLNEKTHNTANMHAATAATATGGKRGQHSQHQQNQNQQQLGARNVRKGMTPKALRPTSSAMSPMVGAGTPQLSGVHGVHHGGWDSRSNAPGTPGTPAGVFGPMLPRPAMSISGGVGGAGGKQSTTAPHKPSRAHTASTIGPSHGRKISSIVGSPRLAPLQTSGAHQQVPHQSQSQFHSQSQPHTQAPTQTQTPMMGPTSASALSSPATSPRYFYLSPRAPF